MEKDINHIIASVLAGQATEKEKKVLEDWLGDPENLKDFIRIKEVWKTKYPEPEFINYKQKRDQLWGEIQVKGNDGIEWGYFIKVAAMIVIVVAAAFFIIQSISNETHSDQLSASPLIEKVTPAGIKSSFNLPDGSRVLLNAESKLTFPISFDDTARFVELQGEAFFQVARDPSRPFMVKSGHTLTTALGTSFNISAYPYEEKVNIALSTGKVKVDVLETNNNFEEVLLVPGEFISLDGENILNRGVFNIDTTIGWKDGLLVFNQSGFNTVIRKLERWYGVKFIYEKEPTWVFDGKFRNENLENILEVLSHSEKFDYSINHKTVNLIFYDTP